MTVRVVSAADVERLLPVAEAIPLMARAFTLFSSGQGVYPLRTHIPMIDPPGDALAMPAYDGGEALGVKFVTIHPRNPAQGLPAVRALHLLVRATDGEPLMLCDGTALTALRTGAASGAATEALARPDARRGALFGVGAQARTQLLAVLAARRLERVAVYARDPAHVLAFCERMSPLVDADLEPAGSPEAALRDADVIVTATSSSVPVFDGAALVPGAHINAVGAYRLDMRELDSRTIAGASVFVDSREAALAEAGDLVIPQRAGEISADHVRAELGEVLSGRAQGRTRPDEITAFKSVGLSVQDVVAAAELYRRAVRENAGAEAEL